MVQLLVIDVMVIWGLDYDLFLMFVFIFLGLRVKWFNVEIFGDLFVEGDEMFEIQVFDEEDMLIFGLLMMVEIVDDDFFIVSVVDFFLFEGDVLCVEGFVVIFFNLVEVLVIVEVLVLNGIVFVGQDYSVVLFLVVVFVGVLQVILDFMVFGDVIEEFDEIFFIDFMSMLIGMLGQNCVQIILIDDDESIGVDIMVNIVDQSFLEGDVMCMDVIVIMFLELVLVLVIVEVIVLDGMVIFGFDYVVDLFFVMVFVGEQIVGFLFSVFGDFVDEFDEIFGV